MVTMRKRRGWQMGEIPESNVEGGEWRILGSVDVDSGQLRIGDPIVTANEYVEFVSGFGDGSYLAYGRVVEIEPGDERIVEVRVILIDQDDITEWMEM